MQTDTFRNGTQKAANGAQNLNVSCLIDRSPCILAHRYSGALLFPFLSFLFFFMNLKEYRKKTE